MLDAAEFKEQSRTRVLYKNRNLNNSNLQAQILIHTVLSFCCYFSLSIAFLGENSTTADPYEGLSSTFSFELFPM